MAILKDSHDPATSDGPLNDSIMVRNTFGTTTILFGQTFTAGSSYRLTQLSVRLGRYIYNPAATITVNLYAVDGDHKPTGASLASTTKSIKSLPDLNGFAAHFGCSPWSVFTFGTPYEVSSGTEYAIVFSCDLASLVGWTGETSLSSGYALYSANTGSSWTTFDGWDFTFQTYSSFSLEDNFETGSEANIDVGGTNWVAQSFTPDSTYLVKAIALRIQRIGAAADIGNIEIGIRATSSSKPSGGDLTVATIYSGDVATGSLSWYEANFDVPYKLSSGTEYCFTVRSTGYTYPAARFQLGYILGDNPFAGGAKSHSSDYGVTWSADANDDIWFRVFGIPTSGVTLPVSDSPLVKRLVTVGGNQFWYEDENGDMIVLSAATDDIDTSKPLTMVEAYGKIFIANEDNIKVADFANVKITTANIGTNPPDFGTVLTGSTTGAVMSVDYVDALSSAVNIYGRRITAVSFQNNETVTGTDDDSNAISFTLNSAETLPPHWYDWTVYGGDTTNFGTMPSRPTLVSKFNGRLVLAGDTSYPHEWWMSKVFNPWDFKYNQGTNLTAVSSGSVNAGEIGDIITALIDYGDDFFIFGCQSSIYILDGDPTYRGTIEKLTESEGVYGARSWCKDKQSNLYFFSGDGLYKADGGRRKPISLSELVLPKWSTDWDLNPDNFRVVCSFDPLRNGIIVSHTSLINGSNQNYWYDIKTTGFYPENYPDNCGIFSSYYYNSLNADKRLLLVGCADGYLRSFYDIQTDDVDASDTNIGIQSWLVMPLIQMNDNPDEQGRLDSLTFVLGGGAANGIFQDSNSMDYEVFVNNDAETVLEAIKDDDAEYTSGTLSTTGKSNRIRPRARGNWLGIRLSNLNDSQTWCINKVFGTITPVGKRGK